MGDGGTKGKSSNLLTEQARIAQGADLNFKNNVAGLISLP